jgi:hypothetical protein
MEQAKDVIEATLQLEAAERARVANELLASARKAAGVDLSPAWQEAVERRLAKIESSDATYLSEDEVFAPSETILRDGRPGR